MTDDDFPPIFSATSDAALARYLCDRMGLDEDTVEFITVLTVSECTHTNHDNKTHLRELRLSFCTDDPDPNRVAAAYRVAAVKAVS